MSQHRAWLRQAQNDRESLDRVLELNDDSTFCQAIAKSQQAVEKSVKALVAALIEHQQLDRKTGWGHSAEQFMTVLIHLPRSRTGTREPQSIIHDIFDERTRGEVRSLDRLAPRRPPPDSPPARNTEYPFLQDGIWQAPADPGVFSECEARRYRALAHRVVAGCAQVVSAVEREAR
jgi:HEPN domain-containing protein